MSTTAFVPAGSVEIPLHQVEQELNQQLKSLHGDGDKPVQRARMSNLIVFCDQREQAEALVGELHETVRHHPARVLLIVGESEPDVPTITASALVRPLDSEQQASACSEMVTLHGSGGGVSRLPFAVRALLVGDLPINMWWAVAEPPPAAGHLLFELAEHAQQILYDSLGWLDPIRGVTASASWLQAIDADFQQGRWRVGSDLNWRRLKYWRRLISQAIEPGSNPQARASANELYIEHGPHAVVEAWLLASWLSRKLGWKVQNGKVQPGVEINWSFQAPHGNARVRIRRLPDGPSNLRQVRLQCQIADHAGALVFTSDGERVQVVPEGVPASPRTVTIRDDSRPETVARQLSDRERDVAFLESMQIAQHLAQRLIQ